jgi:hypothetical protein
MPTDSPFDNRYCGNVGPRIGDSAPRCVLPAGHQGDHRAHESWNTAIRVWPAPPDLGPLVAARKALGDMAQSPRYTLTLTAEQRKAEDQLLAAAIKLADAAIEKES